MKALVTGAGGFVGPHLLSHLRSMGDDAVGFDLRDGPDLLDGPGWSDLLASERPETIYHLAGWSDVGASWRSPIDTFRVNALGTMTLLEAARNAEVKRILLISSADVYGLVEPADQPIDEQLTPQPRSPYGLSKQAAEDAGRQYQRAHGLEVVIVRPFNHLGPGQSPNFVAPSFATQIAQAEVDGHGELAHGDLTARRDLTDVRDVVRAYRLLSVDGVAGETYNVCSGHAESMQQLLDTLIAQSTVTVSTSIDPERLRPVELPILRGSHRKLTNATGWQPEISLETTLIDVLDEARKRLAS